MAAPKIAKTTPFEDHKMTMKQFDELMLNFHGAPLSAELSPNGGREVVIEVGPPGVAKSSASLATAVRLAKKHGYNPVVYESGVTPSKPSSDKDCLILVRSVAGLTSSGLAGFPSTSVDTSAKTEAARRGESVDAASVEYKSKQIIPTDWKTAENYPACIYIFDEIGHVLCPNEMLSFLSEGCYVETKLSKRAIIMGTMNEGVSDHTGNPAGINFATLNRSMVVYIQSMVDHWAEQFGYANVHPVCLAFAKMYPNLFEDFQPPQHKLMNAPTLRSLTNASRALQMFELNKRGAAKSSSVDPVEMSPAEIRMLEQNIFGYLGQSAAATQFSQLYTYTFNAVLPEIRKVLEGKPMSDSFMAALKNETAQKAQSSSTNIEKAMEESAASAAKAFSYAMYMPHQTLQVLKNMAIKAPATETAQKLSAKAATLLENMLIGMSYMPPTLRAMSLNYYQELLQQHNLENSFEKYATASVGKTNPMMVLTAQILHHRSSDPTSSSSAIFKKMMNEMAESRKEAEYLTSLDTGSSNP